MATGVTKKNWEELETIIVSSEEFEGDYSSELLYTGKTEKNILRTSHPEKIYEPILTGNKENNLYYGDNIDVLKHLIKAKKECVNLIYIDPPYGTNSVFQSRHQTSSYRDDLVGSHFIEFMRRRIILMHELLAPNGSIYIHLDNNMVFQVKIILDEIFGPKNFRGFITRKKCSNKNYTKKTYGNISDYILFYSKSDDYIWHRPTDVWTDEKIQKEYPCFDEKKGKRFKKVPIHAPGVRNGETGKEWRGMLPPQGKHWQYTPARLDEMDANGEIFWSSNGNPRRKVYLDEDKGIPVQDIWLDVQDSLNQNIKITGYPTEKNPLLLERIIQASSNPGDLVLDCFAGSGSTLDVAEQLGRKWIGIDNSSESIRHIFKRFFTGLEEMGTYATRAEGSTAASALTLFEPQASYNHSLSNRKNFNFYSDSEYTESIKQVLESYIRDTPSAVSA